MVVEMDETVVVKLENLQGTAAFGLDSFILVIADDDFSSYTIEELRKNDADGVSLYDGQTVWTSGIVNTDISLHSSCASISLQDNGWGISTFICGLNYNPNAGDSISILGRISKYNGLTQFGSADSFIIHSQGIKLSLR